MEYTYLGQTGVKVSELCFGTMSFGGDADEKTSAEMFHFCRDKGINFFDCANVYQKGGAEQILGKLINSCREKVVITTKVYFPTGEGPNARGSSRYHIINAVEQSLTRLNTDRIDIYFLHRFDDFTSLEETLCTLDDLVKQGKILYTAASNFAAWQIEKALGISAKQGLAPFACIQPMYNLVKRQAEVEIFPMALEEKLGVLPYSPLGGGLLSGKYGINKKPENGRLVDNKMYKTRYGNEWMYETAQKFTEFALENDYNPAALAVKWVASHPAVTVPIVGARNINQLKDSIASLDIDMTPELRDKISSLSPAPPPATDRNEENTPDNFGSR
ncbi:MAG: aldo/keto reductase [Candidatus Aminicenantaceae bacterium]